SNYCLSIVGEDSAFCSRACGPSAECPCGMLCTDFAGGESFCTPGGPTACTPSGNPCESADVCISQTCIAGTCKDPCALTAAACAPGQSCRRLKTGSANGVCEAQGAAVWGGSCADDSDCNSNFCEQGACRLPCQVGVTFCGDGQVCWQPEGFTLSVCAEAPVAVDGTDAVDGTGAADGTDGADGFTGATGVDGTVGVDATTGSSGANSQDGSTGTAATGCSQTSAAPSQIPLFIVIISLGLLLARRVRFGSEQAR
ncbi:MAG: hypothetical protein ACI9OJ_004800, partial [Myxococcota bacterium]